MAKNIEDLVNWLGLEVGEKYVSTYLNGTHYIYRLCYTEGKGYFFKIKDRNDCYDDFNNSKEITSLKTIHLLNLKNVKELTDREFLKFA